MITKKPSIFIYSNNADDAVLREICAGIEEEGVFYEIFVQEVAGIDELAWNAANESMLGSGIGIVGQTAALQMRGLELGKNAQFCLSPTEEEARKLGANSARAIKKQAFH